MIKISKTKRDCPAVLQTLGVAETKKNIKAVKAKKFESLKFKVYKHQDVGNALLKVFKNKCAYCEVNTLAGAPYDFEHFRPKSSTIPKGKKRGKFFGYYWLAADWNNLLLSCIHCNRPRGHFIFGSNVKVVVGKSEHFPLTQEGKRWIVFGNKNAFKAEERARLLINPCIDRPETYFVFKITGPDAGCIEPGPALTGFRLKKAEQSILTYGLHRVDLVRARAQHLAEINKKIAIIKREIGRYNLLKPSLKLESLKFIENELNDLVLLTNSDSPFSLLSQQAIKPFLTTLKPFLKSKNVKVKIKQ